MRNTDYSYIYSLNPNQVEGMYSLYSKDPTSVDESWKMFFAGFEYAMDSGVGTTPVENIHLELSVYRLIQGYRSRGHLLSDTNPIRPRKDRKPHLDLADYNINSSDLSKNFAIIKASGIPCDTLGEAIDYLKNIYCSHIGVEYMHSDDTEIRRWFRDRFESTYKKSLFSIEKKKRILHKLNQAVVFENFLNTKYVAQKRFSLEGGENTIPALDAIINTGSKLGVKEFVLGMAHRGRLNVLANILGKTYEYIFNEFEGTAVPDLTMGDGDVKYHLGYSSKVETTHGATPYIKLMPNPSHLEAVSPVVLGYSRAQADILYSKDVSQICPILLHGDAAVAGQGIVYETLQMSQLKGYHVGGAIHFVINNQIGFTTDFDDARSSFYSTSVARTLNIPIIHVNGDDAEAVVFAAELAVEFRQKFHQDIFIDMLCYRRHGHNEADEPKYTQPTLYNEISKHANPREVYLQKLIDGKEIEANLAKSMQDVFKQDLQDRFNLVKQHPLPYYYQKPEEQWANLKKAVVEDFDNSPETAVSKKLLTEIVSYLTTLPENFKPINKVVKLLEERQTRFKNNQLDWAMCELFAYATLVSEGVGVRLSGQDCIRGTFSHRHACFFDEKTNAIYNPFDKLASDKVKFEVYNSLLSEYAVLGFEYGYSLGQPSKINIWEAQFGDFANGAQTIIDQFISSAESKWQRMSGLFLFLPHGYEGQGPEHSNARPERFLQLAAEYNMVVANCTTPANFFHLIRRQSKWNFRKPVIHFSPKSLLRHPACISTVEDLTSAKFQEIIIDHEPVKKVKKLVFCTGKIYFDLLERKNQEKKNDVVLVRLEQLYPMPEKQIAEVIAKYKDAEKIFVQEEPKNMGALTFLSRYDLFKGFDFISRKSSASPATGYASQHKKEQEEILQKVFIKEIL